MRIRPGQRRDVDDIATAALFHLRNGFVATVKDAKQVRFQHGAKIFRRSFFHGFKGADAGIVDENVEAAEFLDRMIDYGSNLSKFSNVANQTNHTPPTMNCEPFRINIGFLRLTVPAHAYVSWCEAQDYTFVIPTTDPLSRFQESLRELPDSLLKFRLCSGSNAHRRTVADQRLGDRAPDAFRAPGDDCSFVVEVHSDYGVRRQSAAAMALCSALTCRRFRSADLSARFQENPV